MTHTRVSYVNDFKPSRNSAQISIYHKTILPIIFVLRIFGIYPYRRRQGEIEFRYKSVVFLYCIALYVLELTITVYTISSSYRSYSLKRFDVVQIYMVVCLSVIPVCTSPLIWISAGELQSFFKRWMSFQSKYNYVTQSPLRCESVKCTIIMYASAFIVVYGAFFAVIDIVDEKWFRGVFVAMCILFHSLFMTLYVMTERTFQTAMHQYKEHIRNSIASNHLGSQLIEEYRLIWVTMSQMVQQFGACFSLLLTMHLVLHSIMFVLLVYNFVGSAAHLLKLKNYLKFAKLFIAPWIPFSMIYVCCNIGHLITKHCAENIPELIVQMKSKLLNFQNDDIVSIKLFLYAISDFKPTVNILGFFEINRPLFGSIISVLVTYMIVLVQFGSS